MKKLLFLAFGLYIAIGGWSGANWETRLQIIACLVILYKVLNSAPSKPKSYALSIEEKVKLVIHTLAAITKENPNLTEPEQIDLASKISGANKDSPFEHNAKRLQYILEITPLNKVKERGAYINRIINATKEKHPELKEAQQLGVALDIAIGNSDDKRRPASTESYKVISRKGRATAKKIDKVVQKILSVSGDEGIEPTTEESDALVSLTYPVVWRGEKFEIHAHFTKSNGSVIINLYDDDGRIVQSLTEGYLSLAFMIAPKGRNQLRSFMKKSAA